MSESYQRLRKFVEIRSANYRSQPGTIETVHEYVGPDPVAHDLLEHDLEQVLAEHSAALDELEKLRTEQNGKPGKRCQALSDTHLSLQCSRTEGHDAAHVAELDGMGRFSWHGDVQQQPEDGDRG